VFVFDYAATIAYSPSADRVGARLRAFAGAPAKRQAAVFAASVLRNPMIRAVLERLAPLDLPQWALTAGCVFQTFWNLAVDAPPAAVAESGGADPMAGIRDYDMFYFDASDLSYEAEDAVIRRCQAACADLDIELEPRNEARVHLWYGDKFGIGIEPYRDVIHAISSFAAPCCAVGLRLDRDGRLTVLAPCGLDDLFTLTMRPNPIGIAPRHVYETKAARWSATWPQLNVLPWQAD
jgi:hypothetical protein